MSNLRRTRTDGRTDDGDASSRARRATDGAECIGGVESGGGDVKGRPTVACSLTTATNGPTDRPKDLPTAERPSHQLSKHAGGTSGKRGFDIAQLPTDHLGHLGQAKARQYRLPWMLPLHYSHMKAEIKAGIQSISNPLNYALDASPPSLSPTRSWYVKATLRAR